MALKVCPTAEDLESPSEFYCSEAACSFVKFKNMANLEMHRVKHHKLLPTVSEGWYGLVNHLHIPTSHLILLFLQPQSEKREFHCPTQNCPYHLTTGDGRSFSSRKYLKQHYQKVHASRSFPCCVCEKKFSTLTLRDVHERTCGNYECPDCHYKYRSREALLSHTRRKHNGNVSVSGLRRNRQKGGKQTTKTTATSASSTAEIGIQTATADIPVTISSPVDTNVEAGTQYELKEDETATNGSEFIDTYCQTIKEERYFDDTFGSCFGTSGGGAMSSIETQTELLEDLIQNSDTLISSMYANDRHTQTCEAILSELLVNDIQTQTMWSGITADCNSDLLLVSTETQTGRFGEENNSIHTQTTIDAFLGAPSSSSSSSTSTHTQT